MNSQTDPTPRKAASKSSKRKDTLLLQRLRQDHSPIRNNARRQEETPEEDVSDPTAKDVALMLALAAEDKEDAGPSQDEDPTSAAAMARVFELIQEPKQEPSKEPDAVPRAVMHRAAERVVFQRVSDFPTTLTLHKLTDDARHVVVTSTILAGKDQTAHSLAKALKKSPEDLFFIGKNPRNEFRITKTFQQAGHTPLVKLTQHVLYYPPSAERAALLRQLEVDAVELGGARKRRGASRRSRSRASRGPAKRAKTKRARAASTKRSATRKRAHRRTRK